MGMRGKKRKQLTQEQKRLVKEFSAWCKIEVEKDFIKQLQNYDPVPDMLNGIGAHATVLGLHTIDPSKNAYDAIIEAMKQLKPISK